MTYEYASRDLATRLLDTDHHKLNKNQKHLGVGSTCIFLKRFSQPVPFGTRVNVTSPDKSAERGYSQHPASLPAAVSRPIRSVLSRVVRYSTRVCKHYFNLVNRDLLGRNVKSTRTSFEYAIQSSRADTTRVNRIGR